MDDQHEETDRGTAEQATRFAQLVSKSGDRGLPVPWGGMAKHRDTGKRTSTNTEPLLFFHGDWEVIDETKNGVPAVFSNGTYGFAGSINIPSHSWAYSAYIGIFPNCEQVGSIVIAPCRLRQASKDVRISKDRQLDDDEDVTERLISDSFPFFVSDRYQYLCLRSENPGPSAMLEKLGMSGFAKLRRRVNTLKQELDVGIQQNLSEDDTFNGDSERGRELNEMIRDEFDL